MACHHELFYKAIEKVFKLDKVIGENCFGCQVNHPSQGQHDLCTMASYGEQLFRCYEEALNNISRPELMDTLLEIVAGGQPFQNVFRTLFIEKDPLEQLKYDKGMQLEFLCFYLQMERPKNMSDRDAIADICHAKDSRDIK